MVAAEVIRLQLVEVAVEDVEVEGVDVGERTHFQDFLRDRQIIQVDIVLDGEVRY